MLAILGLSACAPDLSANGAQRCDTTQPCAEGDVCYRGFCLPEVGRVLSPAQSADASIVYVEVESDGSIVLVEVPTTGQNPDEPVRSGTGSLVDAGSKSMPDASVPTPVDASVPVTRPDATIPGRPDAAIVTPADAAVGRPDAGPKCSQKECCDEAKQFAEDDGKPGKGKKCGCDNLIQALSCGLF